MYICEGLVLNLPPENKPWNVSGYVKKNETNRMEKWKSNVWLIIIICAVIIGYPFFAIKYFETSTALKIVVKYFLLPIVIFLLIYGPKFYYRSVKPLDNKIPKNNFKEKAGDLASIFMMIICSTGILFGISFSLIITTNKLFGKSESVKINERVEKYEPYITKNGRLRHYIDFRNPKTQQIIHLEVYREYYVGEIFEKEMKYGAWGILYSTE